ncbi:MAG: hypothetical protein HQ477_13225 [Chloroflexi bacterium]|nr:hypothetical protein [Chloroflexota bacterium]
MLSVRNLAILAVIVGVVVGISLAMTQNGTSAATSSTSNQSTAPDFSAEHILEMHGEEALIESSLGGFEAIHSGFSSAPEFLRAQLVERGLNAPEGATTEELQALLAEAGVTMDQMHQQ